MNKEQITALGWAEYEDSDPCIWESYRLPGARLLKRTDRLWSEWWDLEYDDGNMAMELYIDISINDLKDAMRLARISIP